MSNENETQAQWMQDPLADPEYVQLMAVKDAAVAHWRVCSARAQELWEEWKAASDASEAAWAERIRAGDALSAWLRAQMDSLERMSQPEQQQGQIGVGPGWLEQANRWATFELLRRSPAAASLTLARQRALESQGKDEALMARSLFIGAWWALDGSTDPLPMVDQWMDGAVQL